MSRRADFLLSQKVMRLATTNQRGEPHVVPVWYMYRNDTVYIGTNTKTIKAQNIAHKKTVAFCVDEGVRAPIYGIMGRGQARLILDHTEVSKLAKQILMRYFDDIMVPSAQELYNDTDCIIAIRVDSLIEWS